MEFPARTTLMDQIRLIDWAQLKAEFVWIYEGEIEEQYRDSRTHHPGQSALLLLEGGVLIETDSGRIQARKGQWIFPRQGPRRQKFSSQTRVLSLHFNLYWPGGAPLFNWKVAHILESISVPRLEKQARTLCRMVERLMPGATRNLPFVQADLKTHLRLQRSFSLWLGTYVETLLDAGIVPSRLSHVDDRVRQAVKILDELPIQVTYDGSWLAHEIGLSSSQLDRLFTSQFQQTPRQYLEQRKLERAIKLLRSGSMSVKQIAYETGFNSLPYFSRWFRSHTGSGPRQFTQQEITHFAPFQRGPRLNQPLTPPTES